MVSCMLCVLVVVVSQCVLCCVFVFCVFFFKQKTAYEMRISDWSSDVCSSDLVGRGGTVPAVPGGFRQRAHRRQPKSLALAVSREPRHDGRRPRDLGDRKSVV